MHIFETVIGLLVAAALLSVVAKRYGIPYPSLLALGGICVSLLPIHGVQDLSLSPDLILTLFVSPVLLDAAHDTSLRDLKNNWRPISSLVIFAVVLTTIAVASVARYLIPDMSWGVAIVLGALLAPPDSVAAMAVLDQVNPPQHIRTVLEGESLLNDASSLLIYKMAIAAVSAGSFHAIDALPAFFLVAIGSVVVGWGLAQIARLQIAVVKDTSIAVIIQFSTAFIVWILAEHLGLSSVVTVVVFGLTISRYSTLSMPAPIRVSSFTIWTSAIFILNALSFTLIGLQMRSVFAGLEHAKCLDLVGQTLVILGVVIAVRLVWVMVYTLMAKSCWSKINPDKQSLLSTKEGLVIAWSGMRGVVSLAAAMALPVNFPHRDFILLAAFVVVIGTLLVQGPTLGTLLKLLRLPKDGTIDTEIKLARETALKSAINGLGKSNTAAAKRLILEYNEALKRTQNFEDPFEIDDNTLRRKIVLVSRKAVFDLLVKGDICDSAYRHVEEELDWLEISATSNKNLE